MSETEHDTATVFSAVTKKTISETKGSAKKFYETFWETPKTRIDRKNGSENDDVDDDDDDNAEDGSDRNGDAEMEAAAMKSISGSSSLDADGGSCGPGDDAFCFSNLAWLAAAAFAAYHMDFLDVAVFSPLRGDNQLNALFYILGVVLLGVNVAIFCYLVVYLSWNRGVKSEDWDSYIPFAVPAATASFVGAAVFLSIALWPKWGVLTVPVLSTVFMGFIVVVSMASQIYKWRLFRKTEVKAKDE